MTEIILCATQRCGSTMVIEDMRNTGVLGMPEEWFIPWQQGRSGEDLTASLANIRKRARTANGISAIKVMANQLHGIENNLKHVIKPPPGPMFFRFHKVFENAVWVWLRRDDIVAQAVSRVMAKQTGINHATAGEAHFAGKPWPVIVMITTRRHGMTTTRSCVNALPLRWRIWHGDGFSKVSG